MVLIGLLMVAMIVVAASDQEDAVPHTVTGDSASHGEDLLPEEKVKQNELFDEIILDEILRLNFLNACEQIGMDCEEIEDLEQVNDWAGGSRYSFAYQGMPFRLYGNMDSSVNTIKLGEDIDIYKQGFEPYQVEDYVVDMGIQPNCR